MSAVFSPDRTHRYVLERQVDMLGGLTACLIGVNPSDADEHKNDQTIRKDLGFARIHGWSTIIKVNKFSLVSTDVRALAAAPQPYDRNTDLYMNGAFARADLLLACWGPLAKLPRPLRERWRVIAALAENHGKPLHCLGTAKDGHPRHTLTLAYATPLQVWTPPGH